MCSLFSCVRTNKINRDVIVIFLDTTEHIFQVENRAKASILFKQVCMHLNLIEYDYFGLQYSINRTKPKNNQPENMRWLNGSKTIKSQIKQFHNPLYFRVRFYAFDTYYFEKEHTMNQFYLQVRKDIFEGRLNLSPEITSTLASYLLQAELGDYQSNQNPLDFISNLYIALPLQIKEIEGKILELYKGHRDLPSSTAKYNFLEQAILVDTYGDTERKNLEVGLRFLSLLIFENGIKIHTFETWSDVSFNDKKKSIECSTKYSSEISNGFVFYLESPEVFECLVTDWVEQYRFLRSRTPLASGGCV